MGKACNSWHIGVVNFMSKRDGRSGSAPQIKALSGTEPVTGRRIAYYQAYDLHVPSLDHKNFYK